MGGVAKICGLVGFVGMIGILTASCATAEAPAGSADGDGHLGAGAAAFLNARCSIFCNDGTEFRDRHFWASGPMSREKFDSINRSFAKDWCEPHGGLKFVGRCNYWDE